MSNTLRVVSIFLLVSIASSPAWAQAQPYQGRPMPPNLPGTFTVIPGGDLAQVLDQTGGDTPLRVIDTMNGNYGIYVLSYQPRERQDAVRGTYHSEVGEVYYVVNGTGTAMLGGRLDNATENNPESNGVLNVTGPSAGGDLLNGTRVDFEPGTILIVPPGIPHQVAYEIRSKTDFLIVRFDPHKTITNH